MQQFQFHSCTISYIISYFLQLWLPYESNNNTETTSSLPNPWGNNNNSSNNNTNNRPRPQMTEGLQNAMMNAMMNNMPGMENMPEAARSQMGRLFSNPDALQAMQRPAVREAMQQIQKNGKNSMKNNFFLKICFNFSIFSFS